MSFKPLLTLYNLNYYVKIPKIYYLYIKCEKFILKITGIVNFHILPVSEIRIGFLNQFSCLHFEMLKFTGIVNFR